MGRKTYNSKQGTTLSLCRFNELKRLGEWQLPNPLDGVRSFREEDKEMSWLTNNQTLELIKACEQYGKDDLTLICKLTVSW